MEQPYTEVISKEVVYREMYTEMRRYRDYELNSSKWYTPMLLAILGFVLKDKMFITVQSSFQSTQSFASEFVILIVLITILIVIASCNGVMVAHKRYKELRQYVNTLEPEWKKFKPTKIAPYTRIFIYTIQLILSAAIIAVVLFF